MHHVQRSELPPLPVRKTMHQTPRYNGIFCISISVARPYDIVKCHSKWQMQFIQLTLLKHFYVIVLTASMRHKPHPFLTSKTTTMIHQPADHRNCDSIISIILRKRWYLQKCGRHDVGNAPSGVCSMKRCDIRRLRFMNFSEHNRTHCFSCNYTYKRQMPQISRAQLKHWLTVSDTTSLRGRS